MSKGIGTIGAGTLAVILLLKNSKRVPGVIGATAIVATLDLAERADVVSPGSVTSRIACLCNSVDYIR
jgi:hypothetical protein